MNNFLIKRLVNILIPYVIVGCCWIGIRVVTNGKVTTAIVEAFSIEYIQPMWFVWVILAAYIVYYLMFKNLTVNKGIYVFLGITLIYIFVSTWVNPRDEMYASIIGMPLGVIWAVYEDDVDAFFKRGFVRKEIVAIAIFLLLFVGRLYLSLKGIDNQLLQSLLRNIITVMFIIPLIEMVKRFKIRNSLLKLLGIISYEIYIIHPYILHFYDEKRKSGDVVSNVYVAIGTVLLTMFFSYTLNGIQELLSKGRA